MIHKNGDIVTLKNGISNVAKFHQDNPYVIDNLKIHFEKIGATITPINFYIKDKKSQLEAICKNGHTFHTKWRIGSNYANTCPECVDLPLYNIEDVKAEISKISKRVEKLMEHEASNAGRIKEEKVTINSN